MKKISRTQPGFVQTGFTLIEMVVVMLILSALAVTAYARISQIDAQARLAALQSLKANVLAVATMAKGVCMSDPQCDGNQNAPSAVIEGNTIYFSYGYPVGWLGNADGAGTLSQLVDAGQFSLQAALSDTNRATYTLQGARDSNHCKLEYAISTGSANSAGLNVTIDSTGC